MIRIDPYDYGKVLPSRVRIDRVEALSRVRLTFADGLATWTGQARINVIPRLEG
jgi:hypothetical protein